MRILLITNSFPSGRQLGGLFLPDLIVELNKLGCEVSILTQNCDSNHTESETLWEGCKVTYFGWRGNHTPLISIFEKVMSNLPLIIQFFLNGIRVGHKIARQWKPDFIFAEWLIPAGLISYGVSRLTGVPYAARALGSDVLVAAEHPVTRKFVRLVARHASVLFADGFDLCKKTSRIAGEKKCHFAPTSRKIGDKRSNFKPLKDDGLFVTLTVGRLHRMKGQDILINAAKALNERGIEFRSYIVGEGEEYKALSNQIHGVGLGHRVILTGKIEDGDYQSLLGHADCVIIPSRSETIPLVLREAVEAQKPLIVADVGDMRYLVEQYRLGYVVPSEDHAKLAEAMERMSKIKNRSEFIQNRDSVISILSVEKAARTIYENLARYLDH
jgi:glycosyltransferase involved in cell wall biosynthesis